MKTVKCTNETCTQNDIPEYFMGDPDYVECGVCHKPCELSELYDDPESCKWSPGTTPSEP